MGKCVILSNFTPPRSYRAHNSILVLAMYAGHGRPTESLTPSQFLQCSALSKMTASVVTYPHEVIRTRLQTLKRPINGGTSPPARTPGIIRTAQSIIVNEGWRGLYRGLSVNLVRTVPNSAVTMVTYVIFDFICCHCSLGSNYRLQVRNASEIPQLAELELIIPRSHTPTAHSLSLVPRR